MDKSLNITNSEDAKKAVSDIEFHGNPDLWVLLCKASSKEQHWMKSTKAMEIEGVGCVVQVTTQQGYRSNETRPGCSIGPELKPEDCIIKYQISESITFVPGVKIWPILDEETNSTVVGYKLIDINYDPTK